MESHGRDFFLAFEKNILQNALRQIKKDLSLGYQSAAMKLRRKQNHTMTRIKMASEIIQAMQFLGIKTENFLALRIQFGGLEGLHTEMAHRLSGK